MSKIAIIAGAGPGTGAAIARRFAQVYPVILLSRSEHTLNPLVKDIKHNGGSAVGIPTDVASIPSMDSTLEQIKSNFGPDLTIAAAIFNVASKFSMKPFLEQSPEQFFGSIEPAVMGAFNFAQATLPFMLHGNKDRYSPTLIFTGATAALKGSSGLSAFAASKFGTRAMAQSLAREFGPKGVHVSHAIIDGIINTEMTKGFGQDIPDAKIEPQGIADTYWHLHTQPRSAFTHEIDIRPYSEKW
ncbi:hypothetical protein PENANT_c019G00390 [Penicillium antarcticum]|uniref:NAD(P)-binding protein n=1 Tax=Penicillium antarcticum TaxID=416450 RepID=A0A1V6Q0Y4_9EURO|nr:oxidoreductase [Penicillium antarcticum]KAJ5316640.1 oxidoreductase [Penicillium antarcticum]OQD82930.1 hypothetical protein PENANT_c019G00390 [Penicillium antarcticum]